MPTRMGHWTAADDALYPTADSHSAVRLMPGFCARRPIKDIHTFVGTFTKYESDIHTEPHVDPLTVDNTLWANTVVASGTAIGLVVYTGRETRR